MLLMLHCYHTILFECYWQGEQQCNPLKYTLQSVVGGPAKNTVNCTTLRSSESDIAILKDAGVSDGDLAHCLMVADKAVEIAQRAGVSLELKLVGRGAFLGGLLVVMALCFLFFMGKQTLLFGKKDAEAFGICSK